MKILILVYQSIVFSQAPSLLMFKRPGVARAILLTPLSLNNYIIHLICHPFILNLKTLSILNRKSWGAAILKKIHTPPFVSCHMSHVR